MNYWLIMKFIGISVAYLGPLDQDTCSKVMASYSMNMDEDFLPFTFKDHIMSRSDITYQCIAMDQHPEIEK